MRAEPSSTRRAIRVAFERFLTYGTEGMGRADLSLVRRSRAFALVICLFLPAAGLSTAIVFQRWELFATGLAGVVLLGLTFRYGHLGGVLGIRLVVHGVLALMLAATTVLALRVGNGSALSVTYPSVLILAACYLLGARATVGWTAASIACLAWVLSRAPMPPGPDGLPSATSMDVFVSRSMVLLLICSLSVVERRFSDRASRELEFLARHDSLTGLLNRHALEERLGRTWARCRRYGRSFALLFVDLDDFKRVNDELGHARGDDLLRVLAERIAAVTRQTDAASRVGGDEFTIVIEDCGEEKNVEVYAERLLALLSHPADLGDDVTISTGASIGIACFPRDADDVEGLMRAADLAMYDAKASGGGRIRFHTAFVPGADRP